MHLFELDLKPLDQVKPWGEPPNQTLHWFGLTDGVYYMNVGGQQLFRYSDDALLRWAAEFPDECSESPYVDYQVIRLYEDVLEMLPNVLSPIPDMVVPYIRTLDAQKAWCKRLTSCIDLAADDDVLNTYFSAVHWFELRTLSSHHLVDGPDIWMWRENEQIHIRWDNRDKLIDDISRWSATSGEICISIDQFISEVRSFHERLMLAMARRVKSVLECNPFPSMVSVDVDWLVREQYEREESLARALKSKADAIDWERARFANDSLLKF